MTWSGWFHPHQEFCSLRAFPQKTLHLFTTLEMVYGAGFYCRTTLCRALSGRGIAFGVLFPVVSISGMVLPVLIQIVLNK